MVQLYSQEEAVLEWGESRYAEGFKEGFAEARAEAREKSRAEGREDDLTEDLEGQDREMAVKLYASGWCVKDISELLDRSINTVSEWLSKTQTQAE